MRVFNRIFLVVGFLFSLSIPTVQADTIRIGMVLPDFTQNQLILDLHDQAQAAAKEDDETDDREIICVFLYFFHENL